MDERVVALPLNSAPKPLPKAGFAMAARVKHPQRVVNFPSSISARSALFSRMSPRDAKLAGLTEPYRTAGTKAYYFAFFDCFNRQLFYEAHEVLEELWRGKPGTNRAFYQGLIQFAGAFVHLQKNRLRPAVALLGLAASNLKDYPPMHEGLDVEKTRSVIRMWTEKVISAGFITNPYSQHTAPRLELQPEHAASKS
jgi:Domain of unknown function (DUF309)